MKSKFRIIPLLSLFVVLPLYGGVSGGLLTPENQTIYLRHIYEQTGDASKLCAVLKLMANTGTYQALTFATAQLGYEETSHAAAQTIWTILKE